MIIMDVVHFAMFIGNPNSRDERSVSGENEPISNKRQSHSLYNGDVSPNQNEPARGKK